MLLYGLYCRLLELDDTDSTEAMNRAFARLESEAEFPAELPAAWRRGYEAMCAYLNTWSSSTQVNLKDFFGLRDAAQLLGESSCLQGHLKRNLEAFVRADQFFL